MRLSWLGSLSLGVDFDALFFGVFLENFVPLHTVKEILSAAAVLNMLNADVDLFLQDLFPELLVDFNTNSMWCDIENTASFSVVELVRHALLVSSITLNINNITTLVAVHIS